MGIAAGMKDIVQDIVSSHESRIRKIGEIREEANEARKESQSLIMGFEAFRQETNQQLRRDLSQGKAKMGAEVRAMRNSFETFHKEMSLAVHQDLAEHTQSVRGHVAKMRQEIGASHQDMSRKLRKDLAQGAAACKSEVNGILNDFQKSHKQTTEQLRKELTNYDRGIKSEVAGIRLETAGMRQETRGDLEEARTAWQGLASTMPEKRSEAEIPQEPEILAEEETIDLEAKMLAAVKEHSEGMTLADIADCLGVAPIVLGRAVKSLVDKAEIRKEEKLYFPVSAE
ncbi:hypothetical protein ACFLUU_02975 [Chloroflexota bacterium]